MAIDEFYRTSAVYTNPFATGEVVNVVDYQLTLESTPVSEFGNCAELAAEVRQATEALWLPEQGSDWTLDRVDCFNIDQPQFSGTSISGVSGGIIGEVVSTRTAIVVAKKTGLRGRSFNGRMFLISPRELNQSGGTITPAYEAIVQSFVDDLIILTTPGVNQYKMVVYSTVLVTGNIVTLMIVRSDMGSIRGRKQVVS